MAARRPTPRVPQSRPSAAAVAVLVIVVLAAFAIALWLGRKVYVPTESELRPEHLIRHDSLTANYTYDGEAIRWYVLIDPDTGVQYLVNDRGGTYPRLDSNGLVMGVDYGEDDYDG